MKRTIRRETLSVALFPFLAVLICTLGVLIVLLVLFTHQAQVEAKTIVGATPASDKLRQAREQFDDAQWRRELLEQQRSEKTAELAQSRARLEHLEDHLRELQRRAAELMARARQIDEGKQLDDTQLAANRDELKRLHDEIGRKEIELAEARRHQAEQEKWYALIPYDGPQGTRRRPIYVECTDRGIVLQPEGLVFRPEDFNGPMGPGNPLDAALRTIREYLQQAEGGKGGDAYPLLVVRPSGVVAYGAARSALKAWDDEFGYELVSDDKKLVYGEPNPVLAASLERTVAQARLRQAALAAAMPRKFGGDEPLTSFDPASVPSIASGSGSAGTRGIGGRGIGGSGGGSGGSGGFGGFGQATAAGPLLGSPTGGGGPGGGGPGGGGSGSGGNVNPAIASAGGASGPYGGVAAGNAAAGQSAAGGQALAGLPSGGGAFGSGGATQPGSMATGGTAAGTAGSSAAGGTSSGSSAGGAAGAPSGGQQSAGGASVNLSPGAKSRGPSQVKSGAARGSNWGLPGAAGRSTGITRPIHVAILLDRVVLIPEIGDNRPQQHIRVPDRLRDSDIDTIVKGVQKEMAAWGLAVEGGYWKPVLEIVVAPDAEHHFLDLQTALQNSGFELHRQQL